VIVQQGQRRAAATGRLEVALEIHLPQAIGQFVLETLPFALGLVVRWRDQPMATQQARDRAGGRHLLMAQILQAPADLARAPGWVLPAQLQHGRLQSLSGLAGAVQRTA
jgi:hypothetical protein